MRPGCGCGYREACCHGMSATRMKSAELETARVSKNPTTVVGQRRSANKRRSDRVCRRIGLFRDTEASRRYTGRSLTRKTLRRSRTFLRVTCGQKPQLIKDGRRIKCSTGNCVPIVVPGLSTSSSSSSPPTSQTSSSQEAVTLTQHLQHRIPHQ